MAFRCKKKTNVMILIRQSMRTFSVITSQYQQIFRHCIYAGVLQDMIALVQNCPPGGSHVCPARPISARLLMTSFHLVCFQCPTLLM